jgi:hypothetical protein
MAKVELNPLVELVDIKLGAALPSAECAIVKANPSTPLKSNIKLPLMSK